MGRVRELRVLQDAFDDARRGHGGVQVVVGEPGVGKTRLAAALVEHAEAHDARVISTRGWLNGPAYWPWTEVVRGLTADLDGETLRRELRCAADQLLRLVPELAARLPRADAPPPDSDDDETARFARFDALV